MLPQYYTVHCIVTGSFSEAIIKQYYNDATNIELTQSNCGGQYDGYNCILTSEAITTNNTYASTRDYKITVQWEAIAIDSGLFRQSINNGDHAFLCTAANSAIENTYKGRTKSIVVRGQ